jgi:hypothetical protein
MATLIPDLRIAAGPFSPVPSQSIKSQKINKKHPSYAFGSMVFGSSAQQQARNNTTK